MAKIKGFYANIKWASRNVLLKVFTYKTVAEFCLIEMQFYSQKR